MRTLDELGQPWAGKDLTKLPNWAQDLINTLQNREDAALQTAEQARLATNPDDSDTILYRFRQDPVGLGCGEKIAFLLGGVTLKDVAGSRSVLGDVQADVRGGRLAIHAARAMAIYPKSSSAIEITLRED